MLLREYVGAHLARRRQRPAKRPQLIDREPPNRYIQMVEHYLPRRIGLVATLAILFGSVGFGIVRGGHVEEFTTRSATPATRWRIPRASASPPSASTAASS